MAKRKRLLVPDSVETPVTVTKSAFPSSRARMPIAEVAGEVAGRAALEEVTRAMTDAEREGRLVRRIPIADIDRQHVNRDRMALDEEEMEALQASIAERGQQMPIEVMRHGGRFALISGLRRLEALSRLGQAEVLAFIRSPADAAEAHVAMVEENEIRAPLSFYERANLAHVATISGVFPDTRTAIATLFARAPAAKRSKIARFLVLREKLGARLTFPSAIPEKLGLALASAIEADPKLASRLGDALRKTPPADAAGERRTLERALRGDGSPKPQKIVIAAGLTLDAKEGRAVLTGQGVDARFLRALQDWAVSRAKTKTSSS